MKKFITILFLSLIFAGCSNSTKSATSKFIKDEYSLYNLQQTVDILQKELKSKNYYLITSFNHEKEALKLKEMLYPTLTVEFNNPKISTKLISCNPTIAQDLPIRVAIYNEINGKTHISYTDPEYWSLKHNVRDKECINLLFLIKNDLQEAVLKATKK
jgi:uncharacterized protein (DUF302 family)